MSKANEPAFPGVVDLEDTAGDTFQRAYGGLTKREYFAGLAMLGILSSFQNTNILQSVVTQSEKEGKTPEVGLSEMAIRQADTLLAELEKEKP